MSRRGEAQERRIVEALSKSARGPLKTKELARALDVPQAEYRAFRRFLTGLEKRGVIHRVKGHRYTVAEASELVPGTLSVTRDGDGFVRRDGAGEDLFVPSAELGGAMDGDRVLARAGRRPRGRLREASIVRVVERARASVVGTYHRGRRLAYVRPLDPRLGREILLAEATVEREAGAVDADGPDEGEVVVVRLTTSGDQRTAPTGTVERVLGRLGEPGVDVLAVAYGHGLALDFPVRVTEEAERIARERSEDEGRGRVDRTDLLTFTIDPADAKDHDDALSIEARADGRFEVGVHIADVSHFVPAGGAVDVEAVSRGTSVYLVDRTIPMLPAVLSGNVCSLRADEDRFALSLFLEMDRSGRIHGRRYERTKIRCRHGLAYETAQAVLDGRGSVSEEVDAALRMLDDLARAVRTDRLERGALDLDMAEARVVLDAAGEPIDIQRRERLESHRLIEDFMILANEAVARDMEARGLGVLYRVHEPPNPEKAEALAETLAQIGLDLKRRKALKPKDVQSVILAARGRPEEALVSMLVLRSMKKARYDIENLGHFGLASGAYLHFTSPIRRYPDLVVHRVVSSVLVDGSDQPYADADALHSVAERSSERERAAEEAERDSVALKKVEYMERHLGDTFHGTITGVASFGFFVTLDEVFVDGLVHVSALGDDYYEHREREHALVGSRGRRRYRLGDRVEVQVSRADKESRRIDFMLLGQSRGRGRGRTPGGETP